jgi:tetratricopeptide (TPR) repeat protein
MTIEQRYTVRLRASLLIVATLLLTMTGCAATGGASREASASVAVPPVAESLAAGDEAARSGDFQRALVHYTRAADVESSADVWLRIGAASSRLDDSQRAVDAFLRVIELEPTQIDAIEGVGLESLALGDTMAAREYLTRALRADPQRWRAHNALGTLDDEAGDHASAIAHYEAALVIYPESPAVLNNLGYSRYLLKDFDQAARDLYTVTQLDPDYDRAWANLALVYAHKGWYADAVDTLAKVADEPAAFNDVGYIALERGDLEVAAELLAEAIRLSPVYFQTAQKNLEVVRARMGGSIRLFDSHDSEINDLVSSSSSSMVADER